jgi:hypothetical protein
MFCAASVHTCEGSRAEVIDDDDGRALPKSSWYSI